MLKLARHTVFLNLMINKIIDFLVNYSSIINTQISNLNHFVQKSLYKFYAIFNFKRDFPVFFDNFLL